MTQLQRIAIALALASICATLTAQAPPVQTQPQAPLGQDSRPRGDADPTPAFEAQLQGLRHAAVRLPLAVGLACVLALRPRRRGTPHRQASIIHTQIILAIVGALVMLVVGASLARAFGIVGAAGLVRYRAKIADPKDAGVMLSTLAVGLASGVGLYMLAAFSTGFVLLVLWIVESFEPKAHEIFFLKVKAKAPAEIRPKVEALLTRYKIEHELRTETKEEITFEVKLPINKNTDRLSNTILNMDPESAEVDWEEKKKKE
jgi:uncharacterized protein DUF4956